MCSLLALLILLLLVSWTHDVDAGVNPVPGLCPGRCSNHGICKYDYLNSGYCDCFAGYVGADCSQRLCPSHYAWVDYPSANNTAHAYFTECSNMGSCDRSTGICKCRKGFTGAACEMTLCPTALTPQSKIAFGNIRDVCAGNGRCMSLRDASLYIDYDKFWGEEEYTEWDADMMYGCVCDPGWEGSACDKKSCPRGDDPNTIGLNEIQVIDCQCTDCTGGLIFVFMGQQSPLIPYDAAEELIKYRLEQFTSIEKVDVRFAQGSQLCSAEGTATVVEFILTPGPKPALKVMRMGGLTGEKITVRSKGQISTLYNVQVRSVAGTKEFIECSNHGVCEYITGTCTCFAGYMSSDGMGNVGARGDCGYRDSFVNPYGAKDGNTYFTSCPFKNDTLCGGHGRCNEKKGTCICDDGYEGLQCNEKSCGRSRAWFGLVGAGHSSYEVCAGVGDCDTSTGICKNCGGDLGVFSGESCEVFDCAKDSNGVTCGDNGACITMREMAKLTYNEQKERVKIYYDDMWDADIIRGCACNRAISVDGQYDQNYRRAYLEYSFFNATSTTNFTYGYLTDEFTRKFYRGPYAFAATDFKGYDCGLALCPKGDYPYTTGVNEIQTMKCDATTGYFVLTFRENTTLPIFANGTTEELQFSLNQIFTIGKVAVTPAETEVCSDTDIYVEFLTEFGDLPLMKVDTRNLHKGASTVTFTLSEYVKGTKEDIECSGLGVCEEATGQCKCLQGFGSSDGNFDTPGERGDCTFYNKRYTMVNAVGG